MRQKTKFLVLSCGSILMFGLLSMAQMMGGSNGNHMGGSGAMGNTGMGGNAGMGAMGGNGAVGSTIDMSGGMGGAMGMAEGAITVSSDGTLYVLSRVFAQDPQATALTDLVKTKLSAVNGSTGNAVWSIIFDEYWLTKPVQGSDGRLFLVAFGDMGMNSGMQGGTLAQTNSKLYVVDSKSGQLISTASLEGEVGSVPVMVGSGAGYMVYVVAFDMGHGVDSQGMVSGPQRESTLYAFDSSGKLLFSRPLNQ